MIAHYDWNLWDYTGLSREVANQQPDGVAQLCVSASHVGALGALGRLRWRRKTLRHFSQTLPQGFSHAFEHLAARFAKFYFRLRGNVRNHLPRTVIQRGHGRQHPLVRNIIKAALVLFGGLLAHLVVNPDRKSTRLNSSHV